LKSGNAQIAIKIFKIIDNMHMPITIKEFSLQQDINFSFFLALENLMKHDKNIEYIKKIILNK
jgi:hypothetical protein